MILRYILFSRYGRAIDSHRVAFMNISQANSHVILFMQNKKVFHKIIFSLPRGFMVVL
jgi:hypothetical protein